jgi:hypothetical protein
MSTEFPRENAGSLIPFAGGDDADELRQQRTSMRAAVIQVITDLVIRRVPPGERAPFFDNASVLLDRAERDLPELIEAVDPGPAQDALFRDLGLD